MFTTPEEDRYERARRARDEEPDWEDITMSHHPQMTWKGILTSTGKKYYILDAALEAIDSTQDEGKVEGLMKHWQAALYGKREKQPGED